MKEVGKKKKKQRCEFVKNVCYFGFTYRRRCDIHKFVCRKRKVFVAYAANSWCLKNLTVHFHVTSLVGSLNSIHRNQSYTFRPATIF